MKILWLNHFVPFPPIGGVRQRTNNLLLQVAARHDVHLVALRQPALCRTPADLEAAKRALGEVVRSMAVFEMPAGQDGWRWALKAATSALSPSPFDVNWMRSPEMSRYLRELVTRERFDLVHLDTIGLAQYLPDVGDLPVALNHHNIESQITSRRAEKESHWAKKLYLHMDALKLARLERIEAARADVNMVVSELDGDRLREVAPGARTAVVANGVDTDYFRPSGTITPDPRRMVFAGSMRWYPNREAMLWFANEIFPALVADDPERRASILGRDPDPEVVAAGVADPRLEVTGFVDDVRPYIEGAGVYVCPIRNGGGTRLKILDTLAMGTPLVATELAVEGLHMEEEVHYLRAETPADYVRQVRRLAEDPALGERLREEGLRLVDRHFSWRVVGETIDTAYRVARDNARASVPGAARLAMAAS